MAERGEDHFGFLLRPIPAGRFAPALAVALAAPGLITGFGYLVSYPRVAIPVLLYLLAMIWAITLGGIVPGIVAAGAGCLGLVFGVLPQQHAASDLNLVDGSIILALFTVVAVAFASVVTRAHRDRRAAEDAEERLRVVLDAAPLAFILIDSEGCVRFWSAAAEQLFGWSREELLGNPLPTIPEGGWDAFREDLAAQLTGKRHRGSELRGRRKDGGEFDVAVWTEPFRDRDGAIVGSLGMVADASETKRLQEALRESQRLESIGRLSGGIAHDFNNVLAIIRGQYDIALARLEQEHPLREDFTQVQHAVDHAASLTRQLLAFSRGQLLQPVELDLNEVIRSAEDMLSRLIGEHIDFATRLAADVPVVLADRTQIEQVLINLAANAHEAMPQGGRFVIATRKVAINGADFPHRPELVAGDYAEISVSDSGEGMAAEVKEQAFEPFFTTRQGKGTGLGLATVYGIVRQSNGAVAIESEAGRGTRVTILLPRSTTHGGVDDNLRGAAHSPRGHETSPPSGAVLVVEDDGLLRRFVQEMLELAGFTVLTASNGEEGLEIFERERGNVDVLLTDIVMPRMSGREVAKRIRALDPHVGVIYTSGYADDPGTGADDAAIDAIMLPKPVTAEQLVAAVTAARNREFQHA